MSLIPQLTDAGRGLLIAALSGSPLNFSKIKIGNGAAPDEPQSGDYWYDTDNLVLNRYSEQWNDCSRPFTAAEEAPTNPSDNDLWYKTDTETLYYYGDGWKVSTQTITCATTQPDNPQQGDYWYDTANDTLYTYGHKWNSKTDVTITCAQNAPASPSAGVCWYDTANTKLNICALVWGEKTGVALTCAATSPASPSVGDLWYDTENSALKKCTAAWTQKTGVNITCAAEAPESPASGDYWYDTTNTALKKYDGTEWQADAQAFYYGETAPETPTVGNWWYDSTASQLKAYSLTWQADAQPFTYASTAPESPASGDWWYDTTNSKLMEYALGWQEDTTHTFNYGTTAPATPNVGDWWYDTSLHVYGDGWNPDNEQAFSYGSAEPTSPADGSWWFDTANSILYEYGKLWQRDTGDTFTYAATAPARAYDFDLWYDTTNAKLKEYSTGWVQDTEKTFTYAETAPEKPSAGAWWFSTGDNSLYEYTGTQWNRNYTTFSVGASAPATQDALTDLVNPILTIEITDMTKGSNYVSITGSFDNSEVTSGFNWAETGIFATDEDGKELLYAYCHTGDEYEFIPANDCGKTLGVNLTLLVMVGDAENVSAVIGEGTLYATRAALEDHKRDFKNPHGVTAEQIGLGNVSNTSPEDTVVSYDIADALTEPEAGDKTSVVFGKLKKAISNLIIHLKAENPHGITPEKIKAAEKSHQHKASDITTGIIGPERGGTGVQSMTELAAKLGAHFSVPVFGVYSGTGTVKRLISLEFTPSAVFVCNGRGMVGDDIDGVCGGLCVGTYGLRTRNCTAPSHETSWSNSDTAMMITTNGFYVSYVANNKIATNKSGETYRYIAFR